MAPSRDESFYMHISWGRQELVAPKKMACQSIPGTVKRQEKACPACTNQNPGPAVDGMIKTRKGPQQQGVVNKVSEQSDCTVRNFDDHYNLEIVNNALTKSNTTAP